MKNVQNSRHIRQGISNPVTLEAEWAGMTAEWKFFIPRYAIRRCSELRPDSFEGQSGRCDWIRAAFERQSKYSDDIWIAFQLNSGNIEIDSGSNRNAFEVHSGPFEAHSGHSGRIWFIWYVCVCVCVCVCVNTCAMPYAFPGSENKAKLHTPCAVNSRRKLTR